MSRGKYEILNTLKESLRLPTGQAKYKILIVVVIILAGFGFANEALAEYYTSGYFISTNLLLDVNPAPTSINSFVYNLSAKPDDTGATVGFNQDGLNPSVCQLTPADSC